MSPPQVSHVLLPKHGHSLSECEDALATNHETGRFAIADGATEAFDSARWAQQLANHWVNANDLIQPEEFWAWLENEGQTHSDSWSGLDLPWYSMEKREAGSFAAFVGVQIDFATKRSRWSAIALGDSCLAHLRSGLIQTVFPVSNSADFSSAPVLAPSCTSLNAKARSSIALTNGDITAGDQILLFSDAVAAWYLSLVEQRDDATKVEFGYLLSSNDESSIANFLEDQRSKGRLKDDDIAIVSVEF